jgi:hypothetical protein
MTISGKGSKTLGVALACACSLLLTGCIASSLGNSEHQGVDVMILNATKADFLKFADRAFGTFHQDVWAPYTAGDITAAHPKDVAAAARAAAYVYHQVQLAASYGASSGTLPKTYALLATMLKHLAWESNQIKHVTRLKAIALVDHEIATVESLATAGGVPIHEKVHSFS